MEGPLNEDDIEEGEAKDQVLDLGHKNSIFKKIGSTNDFSNMHALENESDDFSVSAGSGRERANSGREGSNSDQDNLIN